MTDRRLELIEAEVLRHIAVSKLDTDRRAEHEEVAEALAWALGRLRKEGHPCRSVRLSPLSPRPSARSWTASGRTGKRSASPGK